MREKILEKIRQLAKASGGKPPGAGTFERETGIRESEWLGKIWARWSDALADAGLKPNTAPARIDDDSILRALAEAYRKSGRVLTQSELRLYRRQNESLIPALTTIQRRFATKELLLKGLESWLKTNDGYDDVAAMLADQPIDLQPEGRANTAEGIVYLLKSGTHYKIGRSDNLERRIKEITVSLPEKLALVHSIRTDDPSGIEAYWHRRFELRRANGEWFKLTAPDVAAFKRRKFQ